MTTGQLIKEARKNAGITQSALGKKLGVSTSFIAQYETGKRNPKYDTIRRIAAALGVEWTELVPDESQAKMVADHIVDRVKNAKGPVRKMSIEEVHRLGIINIPFKSDEDRIAYFYSRLNTDGKLAASRCFYQNLDKESIGIVADYVEKLSKIPQYQLADAPDQGTPEADTPAEEPPIEGE